MCTQPTIQKSLHLGGTYDSLGVPTFRERLAFGRQVQEARENSLHSQKEGAVWSQPPRYQEA